MQSFQLIELTDIGLFLMDSMGIILLRNSVRGKKEMLHMSDILEII